MNPCVDYHMHTPLCGHAQGSPEEYVKRAITVGLKEIGFSDHAPLVSHDDPTITMNMSQLSEYHLMIRDVQARFPAISIKLGIEADFIIGFEEKTKAILSSFPYDYVVGSVHFIRQWGFDNPEEKDQWDKQDVNTVYRNYYEVLRKGASTGLFDIIGHVDLVKKFGHRPTEDLKGEIEKTAQVFKTAGVVIEINTAGLRKPVGEIYPSLDDLTIYAQAGIPITFGSDAHAPQEVGCDFDKAAKLALDAGYQEYVTFKDRKIERIEKLL